ncbi:hypothetical protein KCP69_24080 [Salmonella enterica subsp. enterica]|nr:hypothetical protein KCP69_24080 [Salmonella enterica subsp. enterica]
MPFISSGFRCKRHAQLIAEPVVADTKTMLEPAISPPPIRIRATLPGLALVVVTDGEENGRRFFLQW